MNSAMQPCIGKRALANIALGEAKPTEGFIGYKKGLTTLAAILETK